MCVCGVYARKCGSLWDHHDLTYLITSNRIPGHVKLSFIFFKPSSTKHDLPCHDPFIWLVTFAVLVQLIMWIHDPKSYHSASQFHSAKTSLLFLSSTDPSRWGDFRHHAVLLLTAFLYLWLTRTTIFKTSNWYSITIYFSINSYFNIMQLGNMIHCSQIQNYHLSVMTVVKEQCHHHQSCHYFH